MANPGATTLCVGARVCFGISLLPMAWYEYVAWIVPAWTPHLAGSAPAPAGDYFILLLLCALGTAIGAGVSTGLSIASYQALARPRPGGRLTECVVIAGTHVIAVSFLLYVAIYAAIG